MKQSHRQLLASICKAAWRKIKEEGITKSEAFLLIWKAHKFGYNQLSKGENFFKFLKSNGKIREARGTRDSELIPEAFSPKSSTVKYSTAVPFFDLDIMQWRSFSLNNLIPE